MLPMLQALSHSLTHSHSLSHTLTLSHTLSLSYIHVCTLFISANTRAHTIEEYERKDD